MDTRFEPLLQKTEELLKADPSARQGVAVLTAGGAVRGFAGPGIREGGADGEELVKALRESGDTALRCLVCMWSDHTVDLPSHDLRKALLELDSANGATEILLRSGEGYHTKPLSATMPVSRQ